MYDATGSNPGHMCHKRRFHSRAERRGTTSGMGVAVSASSTCTSLPCGNSRWMITRWGNELAACRRCLSGLTVCGRDILNGTVSGWPVRTPVDQEASCRRPTQRKPAQFARGQFSRYIGQPRRAVSARSAIRVASQTMRGSEGRMTGAHGEAYHADCSRIRTPTCRENSPIGKRCRTVLRPCGFCVSRRAVQRG